MSKQLIGATITAIYIASDKEAIKFVTDRGEVVAHCDADCCSHTWIEHVELPALGLPAKVIAEADLELPEGLETDEGLIQFYGLKLPIVRGDFVIDYRNESNGYYGGNLSWPDDEFFYGGVYGQNVSNEEWQLLESDV